MCVFYRPAATAGNAAHRCAGEGLTPDIRLLYDRRLAKFICNTGIGGEGGIRTLGTRETHTAFPVLHLQPLGHLSSSP